MTREEKEKLIRHLKYNMEIGADCLITDKDVVEIIKALEQQPCEDCIGRKAVLDMVEDMTDQFGTKHRVVTEGMISMLPPVTPQPRTGRWIFDEILDRHYYCSECKSMGVDYWDYCPNCGVKMVEPQESEDKE